jgi:hypothetical protein
VGLSRRHRRRIRLLKAMPPLLEHSSGAAMASKSIKGKAASAAVGVFSRTSRSGTDCRSFHTFSAALSRASSLRRFLSQSTVPGRAPSPKRMAYIASPCGDERRLTQQPRSHCYLNPSKTNSDVGTEKLGPSLPRYTNSSLAQNIGQAAECKTFAARAVRFIRIGMYAEVIIQRL